MPIQLLQILLQPSSNLLAVAQFHKGPNIGDRFLKKGPIGDLALGVLVIDIIPLTLDVVKHLRHDNSRHRTTTGHHDRTLQNLRKKVLHEETLQSNTRKEDPNCGPTFVNIFALKKQVVNSLNLIRATGVDIVIDPLDLSTLMGEEVVIEDSP